MAALPPQPVDTNGQPFTRGTSEQELDQWNRALRSSELYQDFLKHIGKVDTGQGVKLSRDEQAQLEAKLQASGIEIPKTDFQIDQGGNLNQGNRLARNVAIAAAIGVGGYFAAPYVASSLGIGGGGSGTVTGTGLGTGSMLAGEGVTAAELGGTAGAGMLGTAGAATGGAGVLSKIGSALKSGSALKGLGSEIGAATNAAGNNRLTQEQLGLQANGQNISGQSAFESELMNRAHTESDQRKDALKDVYRQSYASNRKPGPFNTAGLTPYSAEYTGSLGSLAQQGSERLKTGATYDTTKMTPLAPYKPINIADVQGSTGTKKGTLENIGDWLGPGLSIYDKISQAYGRG